MSVELRHHAKFRGDRSKGCRDIAIFEFFKITAASILDFNDRNGQESRAALFCQILLKSLEPRPRYGDFSIFQYGGGPRRSGPPTKTTWWYLSLQNLAEIDTIVWTMCTF